MRLPILVNGDVSSEKLLKIICNGFVESELKIGIDTGRALCRIASHIPQNFFVGVEVKEDKSAVAAERVSTHQLANVCIVNMEAHTFLRRLNINEYFRAVHLYFPTPWPRSIGLRNRLISMDFIDDLYRILQPGGVIRILTDHKDYYQHACRLFDAERWWAVEWSQVKSGQRKNYYVGTPCEIHYVNQGKEIFALQLFRRIER